MTMFVLAGCYVVTMNGERAEYASGYVAVRGNQIAVVDRGRSPGSSTTPRSSTPPAAWSPRGW